MGRTPLPGDTFLWRILYALDVSPEILASDIDVPFSDVAPLLDPRSGLVEMDRDETWQKIFTYVNERIGELMAVRMELNKALQIDRSKRILRYERLLKRVKKPPLR